MLSQPDRRAGDFDDEELRDQIMTLLLAGHETTATGLAWAFERMVRNPTVMERARQGDDEYLDAVVLRDAARAARHPGRPASLQGPLQLGRSAAAEGGDRDALDLADAQRPLGVRGAR